MHSPMGRVWLVGAGPGDPELLTLKAVRAIAQADVILVDDLVSPAVLTYKKPTARVIHVGKRGGCASTPQAFIERLMMTEAKAGYAVVRLKGGDPFIFGRGGEERQHLVEQGIVVEVVNGITSGLAAASSLGVPLTHRDYAQGCIFVTGHGAKEDGAIDWQALAQLCMSQRFTLVVYMGVGRARTIQQGLLQGGWAINTPAAVVQSASLLEQKTCVTTLSALADEIERLALHSPAVLVVGEVVATADITVLSEKFLQEKQLGC